ncbi:MAG: Stp1/IreP family PP2C-type Ser/Thr phosphatase [Desulfobacteraceae bacterium]|nr:MAG: Stp1/IreP family PP2C-type Ser/Thr phosphatase [Desulfobacteraceae bacterium]
MPRKIFSGKTDIGLKRENNEDALVISPELGFCLAADGMGGAAAGELASRIFVETALEIFADKTDQSEKEILYRVQKVFSFTNEKILEHATQNPNHEGMGCTAELLAFSDEGFVLGHVGDSRTYRFRKGRLHQFTQDHTLVQQQVEEGLISSEKIRNHPLRNVILRAVGLKNELALDLVRGKTISGDLFMLCSDGLTDMVQDERIQDILSSNIDIHQKAEKLVETAKVAGGDDNITVVLASIT